VPQKSYYQNLSEICTFSTFTHVHQTCFAFNFFVHFKKTFKGFDISMSAFYDNRFDKKKLFKVILVLLSNFEAKSAKNGAKNQKTY
jgi:hypothetical protein